MLAEINNRWNNANVKDKKVNGTGELLTQFGDKHTYPRGLPSQEGNPLV